MAIEKHMTKRMTAIISTLLIASSFLLTLSCYEFAPVSGQVTNQGDWPLWGLDAGRTKFQPGPAPNTPDILWSLTMPSNEPKSTDAVMVNGIAYFASALNPNKTLTLNSVCAQLEVHAVDAFTGQYIWKTKFPNLDEQPPYGLSGFGYTLGKQPMVWVQDDKYLFVSYSYYTEPYEWMVPGGIACIDLATGKYMWTLWDLWIYVPGGGMYWPYLYVPEERAVYCMADRSPNRDKSLQAVVCLDASDPSKGPFPEKWEYPCDEAGEVQAYGDGKIYVGSFNFMLWALDAKTGQEVWRTRTDCTFEYASVWKDNSLYHGGASTKLNCYDTTTGKLKWSWQGGGREFFCYGGAIAYGRYYDKTSYYPVVIDGQVSGGSIRCWDAATGELLWTDTDAIIPYGMWAPVVADGKVYVTTKDTSSQSSWNVTEQAFAAFDAFTGERLWTIPFGPVRNPVVAYGNLYIHSGQKFVCMASSKGWSMFRGNPDTPGIAVGQSGPSNIDYPNWKYKTEGAVTSSAAVVDGKVYIGSHDQNLYCLDARSGSFFWKFKINAAYKSSPAVVGGRVYTGADDGNIYCVDAATGTQVWKTFLTNEIDFVFQPGWQPRSSPIITGGKMYVGAIDGKMYCLDLSGNVLWSFATGGPIGASPLINSGVVYFGSTDGNAYALNAETGALKWKTELPDGLVMGRNAVVDSAVLVDGNLWIGGGGGYKPPPPIRWILNASTGQIKTKINIQGGEAPVSSAAYYKGVVYLAEGMRVTAFKPNGTRLWEQWLGFECFSSVTIADDLLQPKIYIGSDVYSITCLDLSTGKPLSVYTTDGQVQSTPALWEGKVYIGSADNYVYCFGKPSTPTGTGADVTPEPTATATPANPTAAPTESPVSAASASPATSAAFSASASNDMYLVAAAVAIIVVVVVVAAVVLRRRK
ncbi:MAG: PQQ-binding-like beta-propeller repeat protein [Candidatus Bathyarchaeia archaeon]